MSDYEYDIPLPENYKELLFWLIENSKKQDVIVWAMLPSKMTPTLLFAGKSQCEFDGDGEDFSFSLSCLGLSIPGAKDRYMLTPKAYKWYTYQKKNRFRRWLARLPNSIKDIAIFTALILSLFLTILEIGNLLF